MHAILAQQSNTDEIFDIESTQRTALIKAAGMFSRPDRDELSHVKDGRLVAKREKESKTKPPVKKRNTSGKQVYLLHQNY
jgi:hypothetical protein